MKRKLNDTFVVRNILLRFTDDELNVYDAHIGNGKLSVTRTQGPNMDTEYLFHKEQPSLSTNINTIAAQMQETIQEFLDKETS